MKEYLDFAQSIIESFGLFGLAIVCITVIVIFTNKWLPYLNRTCGHFAKTRKLYEEATDELEVIYLENLIKVKNKSNFRLKNISLFYEFDNEGGNYRTFKAEKIELPKNKEVVLLSDKVDKIKGLKIMYDKSMTRYYIFIVSVLQRFIKVGFPMPKIIEKMSRDQEAVYSQMVAEAEESLEDNLNYRYMLWQGRDLSGYQIQIFDIGKMYEYEILVFFDNLEQPGSVVLNLLQKRSLNSYFKEHFNHLQMNQYDANKIKEALYLSIEEKLNDYRVLINLSKNSYSENDASYIFKNEIINKEFLNNPNAFISKQIDLLFEVSSSKRLDEIEKEDDSLDE